MARIKIIYDKYNRTFKLVDKEFGALLDDGDVFELLLPLTAEETDDERPVVDLAALAHA
ncbi:MAG TPA: hypothetical protein VGK48_05620 [Terriglobia bacterium]|jgi:hypothetical protein